MVKRTSLDTKIKQSRIKLLFEQPFFGNLVMNLPLEDATDSGWCPTAAVDGRKIYYNREFFNSLKMEELTFVLCHEVLHVALDHLTRKGQRDPEWWNMANDFVINSILHESKIGKMPTTRVPCEVNSSGKKTQAQRVGLYDSKYHGWSSEAVYEDLEKRKVKKELTLDVHFEVQSGGKNEQKGKNPHGGLTVTLTQEEIEQLREEMKNKILQAANASAGKMPAGIKRLIDELLEPKVNWRDLLRNSIQSCLINDFTWMKPNRKHMYSGIFLPSMSKDDTIDLQIAIDMSGSISQEMGKDFMSEIKGIMDQYADYKIGILTFDTKIYNYQEFTKDKIDSFLSYKLVGGGGTDFTCFWNHWENNYIVPKLAVVFTDGYPCGDWGPSQYCDTLWVITEGVKTKVVPPFGRYAYYTHGSGVDEVGEV